VGSVCRWAYEVGSVRKAPVRTEGIGHPRGFGLPPAGISPHYCDCLIHQLMHDTGPAHDSDLPDPWPIYRLPLAIGLVTGVLRADSRTAAGGAMLPDAMRDHAPATVGMLGHGNTARRLSP
jgi:hypothetical protein